MNFEEMEALAKAPQERVNLHVISKLEHMGDNLTDCAATLKRHDKEIGNLKDREASRMWQGKLIWVALTAGLAAWIERLMGGK